MSDTPVPQAYLAAEGVSKYYETIAALEDVSLAVHPGEVVCLLGDNGAGKSTLIQILSGVIQPDSGRVLVQGHEARFGSPNDALDNGIATVFQDLAIVPIMPVYRNFFLGREPAIGWGPFQRFDRARAERIAREELRVLGVDIADVRRPISTLSGGQRQCVAIARAVHFGARVLILDEPTSALGVRQAGIVLDYVRQARDRGVAVILITHNAQHAFPIGDTFAILALGRMVGTYRKAELDLGQLMSLMSGLVAGAPPPAQPPISGPRSQPDLHA